MSDSVSPYALPFAARARFLVWWTWLHDETSGGVARADRAALRRAHDLDAVVCCPAYQRIHHVMAASFDGPGWQSWQLDRLAALVGLAAHLKEGNELSLPHAMSHRAEGTDRNPVSDLRFARLLDAPDIEALFTGLRRLLPLIGNKADPGKLADDVFGWNDRVKKNWAYAYYRWPAKS